MKLYGSPASPYARKARVLIKEKNLPCEFVVEDPWPADSPIPSRNPLGKVPVLEIESGSYLFESVQVVHYLDNVDGKPLTPSDAAVGRILAALPPDTLVILTADHGGHGRVHGARIPVDMTISWIIAGPGVVADHEIAAPVNTMDTAATVAYVLGLTLAPDAAGVPVLEALGSP